MVSSTGSTTGATLINYYQGQAALSLFSASSSGANSAAATSVAALSSYYLAKEGISSSSSSSAAANAPAAPWNSANGTPTPSAAVQKAVDGAAFINPSAATLSAPGGASSQDYQNLFAVYQGLNTLEDLAKTAAANATATAPTISTAQLQSAFASGVNQVQNFLNASPFEGLNMTSGKVTTSQQSTISLPNGTSSSYTTGIVYTGDSASAAAPLQGAVQFIIDVSSKYAPAGSPPTAVDIDLSGMGSQTRTMSNVVGYINKQLKAAGVSSTFSVANLGNATVTSYANGKTTTSAGSPQWGFTINSSSGESLSFSAPDTAAAVYVAQATGGAKTLSSTGTATTTATGEQFIGLQTADNAVGAPPAPTSVSINNSNVPNGGIFATGLPTGVTSVQAATTGADGSIYMVANVSGSVSGAPVAGQQGVALLKYDPSGKLLYTKVLGDGTDSSGYSLAVNTDGTVAVAGANTTQPSTAANGVPTAAAATGFVQVFNPTGAPSWSATIPASGGTSTASGVTFGANGAVYVSGTTTGSVGGQAPQGTSDEFIQGFSSTGTSTFTTQYGAAGGVSTSSGIVYDATSNSLYTAGSENSQAVVRSFALNGANRPAATGSRTLGAATSVVGIGLSGGQLLVGGNTEGATIHTNSVGQAFKGVQDSFVASISTNLAAPSGTDSVTYMGQSGATETATSMAVAGGQAYLTGTMANDPNSLSSSGATEGFVGGVDASTGAVSYGDSFSAPGGQSAPSAIAASAAGTSVLNQLRLPSGPINNAGSALVTANTPIKAGDSFYIRTQPGGPQTAVTVSSSDTLTTLTNKINLALGASGKATVVALGANSELNIAPSNNSAYIELDAQPTNAGLASVTNNSTDVLASLGLSAGVVRTVQTINGLTNPNQLREYGLNLSSSLNLDSKTSAQAAATAIQAAIGVVQQAYQDLVSPPTLATESAAKAQSGTAPTYLTNELANYQAGLNRLTGGSSSSSSSASASSLI